MGIVAITLPRPAVAAIWAIGMPAVHGGVPWLLARIGLHHGWVDGAPGAWNVLGLLPVAAAALGLAWVVVLHVRHAPARSALEWSASYLIARGPYAISRNPMYLGELVLWAGWAVWFGSIAVAIGLAVLWTAIALVVRWEERSLEAQFGTDYLAYRDRTSRWFGMRRGPP